MSLRTCSFNISAHLLQFITSAELIKASHNQASIANYTPNALQTIPKSHHFLHARMLDC